MVSQDLVEANYSAHTNSDSEELYFPYRIYDSRNVPTANLADIIVKKTKGVPCAIDLEQHKEHGRACVVHSNWTGEQSRSIPTSFQD